MKNISSLLGPFSSRTEAVIKTQPILFTLLVFYQGLFSHNAFKIPEKLTTIFENSLVRFISIFLVAFTATQDIEYALISTLLFLSFMYALKTPEERKRYGFV